MGRPNLIDKRFSAVHGRLDPVFSPYQLNKCSFTSPERARHHQTPSVRPVPRGLLIAESGLRDGPAFYVWALCYRMTSSEAPTHIRKKSFEIDRSNTEVTANVGNPCSIRFALLLSYHRAFAYASTVYNERVSHRSCLKTFFLAHQATKVWHPKNFADELGFRLIWGQEDATVCPRPLKQPIRNISFAQLPKNLSNRYDEPIADSVIEVIPECGEPTRIEVFQDLEATRVEDVAHPVS